MRFKIVNAVDGDWFEVRAQTIEEVRTIAYREVGRRGWKDWYSEQI